MDGRMIGGGCLMVVVCAAMSTAVPATHPTVAICGLVGVCLATAAALDDEAAAVTDATPRTARRRMLARGPLASVPLAAWVVVGFMLETRCPEWPFLFAAVVGGAAWIAAFGLAAACRRAGVATPGEAVGTAVGTLVLVLLLAAPSVRGVSPFAARPAALLWWLPVLGFGFVTLIHGTKDRMKPHSNSHPGWNLTRHL